MRRALHWAAAALAVLLTGCAPPKLEVKPAVPPIADFYRKAAAEKQQVFVLDAGRSRVLVRVYRAGLLARFGHDHVVAARAIQGYALLPEGLAGARADLYLPVESLSMDDPALRAKEGLPPDVTTADAEGTRRHMLESVLEAKRFPYVVIHATCAVADCAELTTQITLHGETRSLRVPVVVARGAKSWTVSGGLSLRLTDFGMTPYTTLGGALRVADGIDLSFRLEARPMATD